MKFLAIAFVIGALPAALSAQQRDTTVRLVVKLDRTGWRYDVGDTARFSVSLSRGGRPVRGVKVSVRLGHVRMAPILTDSIDAPVASHVIKATLAEPGFLRLVATVTVDSVGYTALATAAFSPEKITGTVTMPADFREFWTRTIEAARRTPLSPVMTKVPKWSTPDVDVYHVSFQNDRTGSRLYGILSVPTRAGKFPALLVVPGAGVRPYFPDTALARQGVINLKIGIHGIPVDRDSLLYNELRATALFRYWSFGVEDRETYYYKRVFVGVIRAGDLIFGLPQFDGTNYVVRGGSQGGGLSIVAGALDERVKGIAVNYPAMSDHFAYLDGRTGGWPHIFADTVGMRALPEKRETLRYYDVVNFARILRVPGFYTWGYNDNTVPPSASYAAYNEVQASKEMVVVPETEHFTTEEQDDRIKSWFLEKLGVRSRARQAGDSR